MAQTKRSPSRASEERVEMVSGLDGNVRGGTEIRRGSSSTAPILYRIVNGGSSTSMNLIREAKRGQVEQRLFRKTSLYNTILFKYPNFIQPQSPSQQRTTAQRDTAAKPVETAVYIPNDPEMPMGGGYGIYLRRESHAAVLKEFLGIERDVEDEDTIHDLRILDVIDDIPSMDPFLLKSRLDTLGIAIPENCLHISAAEEAAMRRIIEMRIGPILSKAFSRHGGLSAEGLRRALDAIWNPALPESVRFVEAFGFHASETSQMFFALQGVAFYEYLFNETHSRLKPVAEWLNGPAAKPADIIRYPKFDVERMTMLRTEVTKAVGSSLRELHTIFRNYEEAIAAFEKQENPGPLRVFLGGVNGHFWRIGHGLSAMINSCITVEDILQRPGAAAKFDTVMETLSRLRVSMSDRADAHSI